MVIEIEIKKKVYVGSLLLFLHVGSLEPNRIVE